MDLESKNPYPLTSDVAVVEKCTLGGANTFTVMKHKHKEHTNL